MNISQAVNRKLLSASLIFLLWPLASQAGTFELKDPAAEIYAEQQAPPEQQEPEKDPIQAKEIFCAVDEEEGKCWCVHRETAKVVTIEHEECMVHASQKSPSKP